MLIVHARSKENNSQPLCRVKMDKLDIRASEEYTLEELSMETCECCTYHILERAGQEPIRHNCADCDNLLAEESTSKNPYRFTLDESIRLTDACIRLAQETGWTIAQSRDFILSLT